MDNEQNLQFNKTYVHTFQQGYVDDDKRFYIKYICTERERINLLTKRETRLTKLQHI